MKPRGFKSEGNAMEKSVMMRHMMHFVGDIHQPMHTTTMYSEKFRRGDMGGNFFKI